MSEVQYSGQFSGPTRAAVNILYTARFETGGGEGVVVEEEEEEEKSSSDCGISANLFAPLHRTDRGDSPRV